MAEANYVQDGMMLDYTPDAAIAAGQVIQLADGRAAFAPTAIAAGVLGAVQVCGIVEVEKTTSMVLLDGLDCYWDHSANKAHYKKVNDRDFFLGVVKGDAASAATTVKVALNVQPVWDIDINRDAYLSVPTGTQVVGAFGHVKPFGGARGLQLTATNEAQCIDILSVDRFDKNANAIVKAIFRLGTNGSTSDVDFNIGIANGTSTTDADAITEHVLFHIDGGALTILAQSKDGTTTVSATTTGVSATAGSAVADRFELWIDTRTTTSVKLYVNGAAVATGSTFRIDGATGPFGLLAHLEKVSGTATAGPMLVDKFVAHYAEQ
jgi:predicted RecA/RadA family phage recombinase